METVNKQERSLVWNGMLDADLATRYYTHLAHRLERYDRWLGVATFIFASAAAGSVMLQLGKWAQLGFPVLTVLASGVGIYFRFSRAAHHAASLYRQFGLVLASYEQLWARVDELPAEQVRAEYQTLQQRTITMTETAAREFGDQKKLAERAHREVLQSRGFAAQA